MVQDAGSELEGQLIFPWIRGYLGEHRRRCPCPDCVSGRQHELAPPDKLGGRHCYRCTRYYFSTWDARRSPCVK